MAPSKPLAGKLPIVFTSQAMCRDCYRCVRVCPVHAIKMDHGQAQVVPELCIACGTCIDECPQHAKAYRTDYNKVIDMLEQGDRLAISIAPSFAACYSEWAFRRLPSALRAIGFQHVAETAVGAWYTATASAAYIKENPDQNHICTACPAVVSYIAQYQPQFAANLVPVVSPMVAHARLIKNTDPDIKFVFAGPCVAKKDEASQKSNLSLIDAVLTFEELDELFNWRQINLESCEESSFDVPVSGDARLFPLEGGLLRTAHLQTDVLDEKVIAISGFDELDELLHSMAGQPQSKWVIEPLFCKQGCINGPAAKRSEGSFARRHEVIQYARLNPGVSEPEAIETSAFETNYQSRKQSSKSFTEEEIRQVLAAIGKHKPEDELNCMACGYNSCREKALAVLNGLAEPEMCMPFMRQMAEQKFDTMIKHDPNGIVLLNHKLAIMHMNESFKKMFSCSDALIGRPISYLIDPDAFEKLSAGTETLIRQTVHYNNYNLICHQMSYAIPDQQQYVGIFMDVTDLQVKSEQLNEIKAETVLKAQELIDHQISMAQELAQFLGEHTAKGEVMLSKLMDSIKK